MFYLLSKFRDIPLAKKIFLILLCSCLVYSLISYGILRYIIFPSYIELEYKEAEKDINRIDQAIQREIAHIDIFCRDWAFWDDTVDFINTISSDYIEANLTTTAFVSNEFDLIYYCNTQNFVTWGNMYDAKKKSFYVPTDIPVGFLPESHPFIISSNQTDEPKKISTKGIMKLTDGLLLFAVRPILTSEAAGPIKGSIIMGRLFSNKLIEKIKFQTKFDFEIIKINKTIQSMHGKIISSLSNPLNSILIEHNQEYVGYCYSIFSDYQGKPLFVIKMKFPAEIIRKGTEIFQYALYSTIISSVAILVAILLLIGETVLKPIKALTGHINLISSTGNLKSRINIERRDEIGILTTQYNRMLEQLDEKTAELHRIAITDDLTGLHNHRYIIDRLNKAISYASRYQNTFSIVLFDVDHFKQVNDTYGHNVGDDVLRVVAQKILSSIRDNDELGRYGGEEFLLILPNQSADIAQQVANRIREGVEFLSWGHKGLHVTISGGVSIFQNQTATEMIIAADKNLYKAKKEGRNQIVIHT